MDTFDIFIAYVPFGDGGKVRPVLLWDKGGDEYGIFSITTQYNVRVFTHRACYYPIRDWAAAGLDKASYIDSSDLVHLKKVPYPFVGTLSEYDTAAFIEFCANTPDFPL